MFGSKKIIYTLAVGLVTVLFVWGGLGIGTQTLRTLGLFVPTALVAIMFFIKKKLDLPKGAGLFLIFLILLLANLGWSQGKNATIEYLILFLSGGAIWLLTYNLGKKFSASFEKIVLVLGIVFGASFLLNLLFYSEMPVRPWTLYLPGTFARNHNHLGDMWAVVMLILIQRIFAKPKWWHGVMLALGVFFLTVSLSRSADLALAVGSIFIFTKAKLGINLKPFKTLFLILPALLFIFAGIFKSTFASRPYFEQFFWGLKKWPWGVGVGNFGNISADPTSPWWSGPHTGIISSLTHNIILEVVIGMGILGVVFIAWFVVIHLNLLKNSKLNPLYVACFLAISANFMFDTTYYIYTMIWLWFGFLGLAQASGED